MIEIQNGLYLETKTKFFQGKNVQIRRLIAKEGFCFYSVIEKKYIESLPDSEEEKPKLKYMKEAFLGINDRVENYISVVIEPHFNIV